MESYLLQMQFISRSHYSHYTWGKDIVANKIYHDNVEWTFKLIQSNTLQTETTKDLSKL